MMKPIAPDIKNPLYDGPVRPDMPKQTLNPRQVRDQAIASAKDARQKALEAARAMEAGGQRLAAKKSALGDYNKARQAAQQQYQQTKLGPRTGGPSIDIKPLPPTMQQPGLRPPSNKPIPELIDDRPLKPGIKPRPIGTVKKYKSGGSVSASKRADGCAIKGKTRGRIV